MGAYGGWMFDAYEDEIRLESIMVDSELFYELSLNDNSEESKEYQVDTSLLPIVYLKEDIEVSETDYFLTIYELSTADKTGYVKYVKK